MSWLTKLFGSKKSSKNLYDAIKKDDVNTTSTLLRDFDVDFDDGKTGPLLHFAAYANSVDVVMLLIEKGANINIQDKLGATALYYAGWMGNNRVVELLVEHGAKPSEYDMRELSKLAHRR